MFGAKMTAKWLLFPGLVVSFACGCAAPITASTIINIDSEPAGAEVYVMGEKVGTTPLGISQTTVFPPTFPSEKQALYGVVTVRKAGCKDSIQRVSGDALDNGLQVRLECGDIEREAATAKVGANVVESRLRRVQDLREKGLITEQEARNLRQRILGEL